MKKVFLIQAALLFLGGALFAQSADRLTEAIKTKEMTYGQFAYFAGCAEGIVSDDASYEESLEVFKGRNLIEDRISASDAIPLDAISYICAETWNISGSLFYKIFPGKRYAFKMLKAKGILSPIADPKKLSGGREAVNIITACIALKGDAE